MLTNEQGMLVWKASPQNCCHGFRAGGHKLLIRECLNRTYCD